MEADLTARQARPTEATESSVQSARAGPKRPIRRQRVAPADGDLRGNILSAV
jgi:hypothetical protein